MSIGYTHALFTGNLRSIALKVDKKDNGGNDNGLIDGKEIKQFKDLVKTTYGIDFDFNAIKQSSEKDVAIKNNNGGYKYNTMTELSNAYQNNGTNSKTIKFLNGGDPFAKLKNNTAKISYLNENDFKESQKYVKEQEDKINSKIEEKRNQKNQEKINANKTPNFLDDPIGWLKDRLLKH